MSARTEFRLSGRARVTRFSINVYYTGALLPSEVRPRDEGVGGEFIRQRRLVYNSVSHRLRKVAGTCALYGESGANKAGGRRIAKPIPVRTSSPGQRSAGTFVRQDARGRERRRVFATSRADRRTDIRTRDYPPRSPRSRPRAQTLLSVRPVSSPSCRAFEI